MVGKDQGTENQLVAVVEGGLHADSKRLSVVARPVGATEFFDVDRGVVFSDFRVPARDRAGGVGGAEIHGGIDPFTGAGSTY